MLTVIYGTNASARHDSKEALLKKKLKEGTTLVVRTGSDLSITEVEQLAEGGSLFGDNFIVVLEYPSEQELFFDSLLSYIDVLVSSPTLFILTEREIIKDILQKYIKGGAEIVECQELKKNTTKKDFNIFSLTDAFIERNKKESWLLYRQAIEANHEPEEIGGILFWAIKNMLLVSTSSSVKETGLNPFVAQKSVAALKKWKKNELENVSRKLVEITHESRNGKLVYEEALEAYILTSL